MKCRKIHLLFRMPIKNGTDTETRVCLRHDQRSDPLESVHQLIEGLT